MSDLIVATLVSAALALGGALAVCALLRPRLHKHAGHALAFAAPALVLGLAATVLLALRGPLASFPLWPPAALCVAVGWCFVPTRGSRFREFQRDFWAYVETHPRVQVDD